MIEIGGQVYAADDPVVIVVFAGALVAGLMLLLVWLALRASTRSARAMEPCGLISPSNIACRLVSLGCVDKLTPSVQCFSKRLHCKVVSKPHKLSDINLP